MNDLVLGPLLRFVDEHHAALWVEVSQAGEVTVTAGARAGRARTFVVHGHHYALVTLDGLEPGTKYPYTVHVDGVAVWPPADSPYPPSVIPTLDHTKPLRLAFGSCRTSVPHDAAGNASHGVDALRAYALRMAGVTDGSHPDDPDPGAAVRWPDVVLFLGDQVYADETSEAMREFIESRRDIDEEPGTELKDYQEYAELYRLAWTDPANRWLLSTVPSAMIFDDHDIRDDWNTSLDWKQEMEATTWWHERVVSGLASYWVHQHLGNLSPAERAGDPIWQKIAAHEGAGEYDATDLLDAFADRADQDPKSYRWSFTRDFGTQARLIVVDSRAARELDPDHRAMLDADEFQWFDEQLRGGFDHVLVGTSLPFLLGPGLHHVEAFSEALAGGGWGSDAARGRRGAAPARGPGALGGVPEGLPAGLRDGARGGARASAGRCRGRSPSCPATSTTATCRRRVPPGTRADRRPAARSSRRSARRSATRCPVRCGSRWRPCPTAWPVRSGAWSRRRPRCRAPRWTGGCSRARGSTTTWRRSRSPTTGCTCGGPPGVVEDEQHDRPRFAKVAEMDIAR